MKKLALLMVSCIIFSCSTTKRASLAPVENELLNTRRYIGNFIDYCHTGPETFGGTHLIWIKTTMFNTFGKISAYGKKCEFSRGDRLFLTRNYYSPGGITGYWIYMIENDSTLSYRVTDYQHDHKVMVNTFFN